MEEEETTSSSRRTGKRHITGGGSSAVNRGKGIGGGAFGAKKAKVSGPETGPETESAPAQSMSDTGKSWWGSSTSLARRLFSFLTTGGSDPPQRTSFLRVPGFAEKYSESGHRNWWWEGGDSGDDFLIDSVTTEAYFRERGSMHVREGLHEPAKPTTNLFKYVKDEKKEKEGRGEEKKRGGEKGGERKEGGKSLFLQGLYIISTYTVLF